MADINSITSGASYVGNKNLGGAQGVGITIDSTPLERLATFQYYRDRDLWQKKQRDDFMAAKQIADIAAYDVNSPFKEYTNDLTKDLNKVRDYFRNTKDAIVYNPNNPQPYIDGQEMLGKFSNKRTHATANDALYNSALAKVNLIQDINDRNAAKEILDINAKNLFSGGIDEAYNKQFEVNPEPKAEDFTIPEISLREKYFIKRNANDTVTYGVKYADIPHARAQADGIYYGLEQKALKTDSPEFKNLSQDEQRKAILQDKVTSKVKIGLDNLSNTLNGIIKSIGVPIADIPQNILSKNSTLAGIISDTKLYNEQVDRINAATGETNEHIKLDDGISPQEIIILQGVHKNKGSLLTEIAPKVDETDLEIKRGHLSVAWGTLGLAKEKLKAANTEDLTGADVVLRTLSNIINKGESAAGAYLPDINIEGFYKSKGNNNTVFTIADPTLLQQFGKIDKDGVHYDIPNTVQYNKKTGQLNLIYFKTKFDSDTQTNITDTDENGKPIIDENKTKSLDERTWIAETTKQLFPNKDIGTINSLVNSALVANGNSLYKVSQKYSTKPEDISGGDKKYLNDNNTANWKNNGDGTYTYIPTGQKVDSKTGKLIQ